MDIELVVQFQQLCFIIILFYLKQTKTSDSKYRCVCVCLVPLHWSKDCRVMCVCVCVSQMVDWIVLYLAQTSNISLVNYPSATVI